MAGWESVEGGGSMVKNDLAAPLDVLVVRKVGVPWQPELGAGAVCEGGHVHPA